MAWFVPLHLALGAAVVAAPATGPCDPDAPFRLGAVDRTASVLTPAPVGRPFRRRHDSTEVRVRLRFVVGCDGRAEPSSFALVEAGDSSYVLSAVALVQASRFAPATVEGVAVRQLLERTVVWRRPAVATVVEFVCPPPSAAGELRALRSEADRRRPPPRAPIPPGRGVIS